MKKPYRDALEIAGAFAAAFLFYQFLALATGTQLPIVSVVSDSMYHRSGFDKWWAASGQYYEGAGITREEFLGYRNFNGLSRGDLLLALKAADLKEGDIVIYQRGGSGITVVHRIVGIGGSTLLTKGDNNAAADQPVLESDVQGKVAFVVPVLGYPRFLLHLAGI